MKTCIKCAVQKPSDEFYAHPQMADGRLGKCKECCKAATRERTERMSHDPKWVAAQIERSRVSARRRRAEGLVEPAPNEKRRVYLARHRAKYPERNRARAAVTRAVRSGRLLPQPCHCGQPAQAHHDDYTKPLEVLWLCPRHHADRHVELRQLQQAVRTTP